MTTPALNDDLVRPIVGIENRTPQEVFDIMADRIKRHSAAQAERISVLERALEWQPIETAPKDGTPVLLGHDAAVFSGWWTDENTNTNAGGWIDGVQNNFEEYCTYPATHWMLLPPLPTEGAR